MKTFKLNLLGLALAGLILGACSQTGTYENADLMNEQAAANKAGFKLTPFGSGSENASMQYVGAYFSYTTAEACIGSPVTISFNIGQPAINCGTVRIDMRAPGDADWTESFTTGTPALGIYTFQFTPTTEGDYRFRGKYDRQNLGGGNFCGTNVTFKEDAPLKAIVCGCDDEFTGTTGLCTDGSRSATFTFTAGDDATYTIQGGLTAFITDVVVDGATVINVTGQGNNIISWTGAMDECDVKTITVKWNSTNGDALITGDWTVKRGTELILTVDELECDDEKDGYAPPVI